MFKLDDENFSCTLKNLPPYYQSLELGYLGTQILIFNYFIISKRMWSEEIKKKKKTPKLANMNTGYIDK